jgi:hypothetical protein
MGKSLRSLLANARLFGWFVGCTLVCHANFGFSQEDGDELEIRTSEEVKAIEEATEEEGDIDDKGVEESSEKESEESVSSTPWVTPPKKMDPCYNLPEVPKLKAMTSILRQQHFITADVPTDLLLRCNERSASVTLAQETIESKVKTSNFTANTKDQSRGIAAYSTGGDVFFRYGLQLATAVTDQTSKLESDGAANAPESAKIDTTLLRIESALRLKNIALGASILQSTTSSTNTIQVAGSNVSTSNERISLYQPGLALDWKIKDTQVLLGRVQAAEESTKSATARLPWSNYMRVISLLEQDQGVRLQIERSGAVTTDSTEYNKGLVAYFLSVDNVTVDIAWFGKSASYKSSTNAIGSQLTAFCFTASLVWQFFSDAELFLSLHSSNANDSLGGAAKRSAHQNVAGGQMGAQYTF